MNQHNRYDDQLDAALAQIAQKQIFTISMAMDLPSYERTQAIEVIETLAGLKESTPQAIEKTVQKNFLRLIGDDPWLSYVLQKIEQD